MHFYTIDQFFLILHPLQKYTRWIYFDFRRRDSTIPFEFENMTKLKISLTFVLFELICNLIKFILEIRADRLSEAKQIAAVTSIALLCMIRGISLYTDRNRMLAICNDLDKIFPNTVYLQQRMRVQKLAASFKVRFRVLRIYVYVGLPSFASIPLIRYFLFYDRENGGPLLDEYHQHASWAPFELKQNNRAYPYVYVYETFVTILGFTCILTWDHIFTVTVSQLTMHFEFVNTELESLNVRDTTGRMKSKLFWRRFKEIIVYHQHVYRLAKKLNETFNLTIFLTDIGCAGSICFHLYLIANSDSILTIVTFFFPCFILIAFTFDYCHQGSRLAEASARLQTILYTQKWYDASPTYRRLMLSLLQYAHKPFTLNGFKLFDLDMLHFQSIMTIAYRLFAFVQSQGK
ncbi:odorant receptor 88a-like [Glossina fuscipes fuscipes]